MIHAYKVVLRYPVYAVGAFCDGGECTVTVRAFSAEDALTIVRTRLKAHHADPNNIENIYCEEDKNT
jgi:hypothetical protein